MMETIIPAVILVALGAWLRRARREDQRKREGRKPETREWFV
jgi:hypothetical protein